MRRFVERNEEATHRLGAAIRQLRRDRGMTLVVLAEHTGLSHSFLSQLERGLTGVSMKALYLIADGLATTPQALVAATLTTPAPATGPIRAGDQPVLFASRILHAASGEVRVIELTLEPDAPGRFFTHDQPELVYVVSGGLETAFRSDDVDDVHHLATRDALMIPSGMPHKHRSTTPEGTVCLLVQSTPG